MTTLENITAIDRCLEIEQQVDIMVKPSLLPTSSEDIDEVYQERLEYNYWLDDMIDEYNQYNIILGYPNRRLFPKSLRRIND